MDRLAEPAPIMADAMLPRVARVARRVRELSDTWTLDLVAPDGGPLMLTGISPTPNAYIMVNWPGA